VDSTKFTGRLRNIVFGALTGIAGDVSGDRGGELRDMLMAIGGPAKTKSGINLTEVAKELGVTRRTVERWVTTDGTERGKPKPQTLEAVAKKSRQAATTQRGRAKALARMRGGTGVGSGGAAIGTYGAKLAVRARQGVVAGGRGYLRDRTISLELDPGQVEAMQAAYAQGGDKAFVQWAENHADANYAAGWGMDRIDSLELGR